MDEVDVIPAWLTETLPATLEVEPETDEEELYESAEDALDDVEDCCGAETFTVTYAYAEVHNRMVPTTSIVALPAEYASTYRTPLEYDARATDGFEEEAVAEE